jgi:peptide/nickel transport system substrate-binding protein
MNRKFLLIACLTLILITSMSSPLLAEGYTPPHSNPGPAVDRIIFRKVDQDLAPKLIEKGDIDLYLYSLKISTAEQYMRSETVWIYQAPSTTISILLNPAPAPEGD